MHQDEVDTLSRKRFKKTIERAKQIAQTKKNRISVRKFGTKPSPQEFQAQQAARLGEKD